VAQTEKVRLRYWAHWAHFCADLHHLDPLLQGLDDRSRIDLLLSFARYVREGHAGRGHQVRAGSVSTALCAIGKTFELDDRPNPTYKPTAYKHHWEALARQLRAYRRDDPPTEPQLAVPVSLTEWLLRTSWLNLNQSPATLRQLAEADLCNIAFYFLLRVGEYTRPRSKHTKNTIPFSAMHVTFWDQHGRTIPTTSSLSRLYQATSASIKIPRQKNGEKGQTIHQECTGTPFSPIKSLARRVHHTTSHGGTPQTPIYCVYNPSATTWHQVTPEHINKAIRQAAAGTDLYAQGYTEADVSSHSLRAGGAMAMHLAGCNMLTIKKMGRWKSYTFETYIHEQISAFSAGVSTKMSELIPFRQIRGPTAHEPDS